MARTKTSRRSRRRQATSKGTQTVVLTAPRGSERGTADASEGQVEAEGLSVTHWFTPAPADAPYAATVRFTGRRLGTDGKPGPRDAFVRDETMEAVVPGSGPVSVTAIVPGLEPGDWTVSAEVVDGTPGSPLARARRVPGSGHTLPRAAWSWWRWSLSSGTFGAVHTRWGPLVRLVPVPAVIPGSWSALVATGVVVGAWIHVLLMSRVGIGAGSVLLVDLVAVVAGLLGAKAWYLVVRPRDAPGQSMVEGWTVDGFILAAPAVLAALAILGLPIGAFFDAGTPALFFGIAIGRLGCFFTGCCAGRCTASRWGIWSSDRRIGARRIPTQLLESATGLILAIVTLLVVLAGGPSVGGAVFAGGLAAYVLVRQFLLRLRTEPHSATRARVTAVLAGAVLLADALVVLIAG